MSAHDGVAFAPHREDEPDRMPGESRSAYKRRTIPGYAEEERKKRQQQGMRRAVRRADVRLELLRSGEITEEEYALRTATSDRHYDGNAT